MSLTGYRVLSIESEHGPLQTVVLDRPARYRCHHCGLGQHNRRVTLKDNRWTQPICPDACTEELARAHGFSRR